LAKDDMIEFEGVVRDVLPDGLYRVELDNGHDIIAYTAGRMKKFKIRILAGDRVTVEMTPYDLTKGRINFRHKDERSGGPGPGGPRRQPPRKRR
jgi:translation initiation factor IF-1